MTQLIQYHPRTTNVALFQTEGRYWIGSYSPHLTHTNGEPDYVWIRGDFDSESAGAAVLTALTGEEL